MYTKVGCENGFKGDIHMQSAKTVHLLEQAQLLKAQTSRNATRYIFLPVTGSMSRTVGCENGFKGDIYMQSAKTARRTRTVARCSNWQEMQHVTEPLLFSDHQIT